MKLTKKYINDLITKYTIISEQIRKFKLPNIAGTLQTYLSKGCYQYYIRIKNPESNKFKRIYLNKSDKNKIQILAQKEYLYKANKIVKRNLKALEYFNKNFDDAALDNLYENTLKPKQNFISPITMTKNQIFKKWRNITYTPKPITDEFIIIAKNGERVRSKSEKILADIFYDNRLEYKYEKPLNLKNLSINPDFTFLDKDTCKEIYWEHFGMMDNLNYVSSVIDKIESYQMNNIYLGERLIITFESSNKNLNYLLVKNLINKYNFLKR